MPDILDMIETLLGEMKNTKGIEACVVASRDGLLIQSKMEKKHHAESFAAMSATMLGAAETATTEMGKGIPNRLIVESDHCRLIIIGTGAKSLLITLVDKDVELAETLAEIDKSALKLKRILK